MDTAWEPSMQEKFVIYPENEVSLTILSPSHYFRHQGVTTYISIFVCLRHTSQQDAKKKTAS
jgi:hypothetical protein